METVSGDQNSGDRPTVGLFVTCLVDLFRPSVAFASIRLLEAAGCDVVVPTGQTCCGQPAWNAGDARTAADLAKRAIDAFEDVDHVVAPSGSCAATLRKDYPEMLADAPDWADRARALAAKTFELTQYLTDVRGVSGVDAALDASVTLHDSCSGLRSLGVEAQPRRLLQSVDGLELREMADADVCCGFGGAFCVSYPEISNKMVADKVDAILASNARIATAGEMGCLINIAGKLARRGAAVEVRHIAEILAGDMETPPIAGPAEDRG